MDEITKRSGNFLYSRQKVLLALLQAFGGKLSNINFQKYLFLYTQKCEKEKSYEFIPYKRGCFSFQSYADRRKLIELNVIENNKTDWTLINSDRYDYLSLLDSDSSKKIRFFKNAYHNVSGDQLIKEVYSKYPYYAIRSEIAEKLMSKEELERIEKEKSIDEEYSFFTIGYEGNSFEDYLNRLIKNNIKVLCDVRKNPLSRKYGFSKKTLEETLKKIDIEYVHLPDLGVESEKRKSLNSRIDYINLFDEYKKNTLPNNSDALDKLYKIFFKNRRVAITCFEAEHTMCHRSCISEAISKYKNWNYKIIHI